MTYSAMLRTFAVLSRAWLPAVLAAGAPAAAQQSAAIPIQAATAPAAVQCGASAKPRVAPEPVPPLVDRHPEVLEEALASANPRYDKKYVGGKGEEFPSYKGIAALYKKWCSRYGVRFDLAFAQMLHETNYLRFTGSVRPGSFNFAGINAPHDKAPGEQYLGIEHGVKAHCQHLAAYALVDVTGGGGPLAGALNEAPVCGRLGDPLATIGNASCYESPYTERVRRSTIWPRICKALGRPATFKDLGPSDNQCLGRVDARGRCCDATFERKDKDGKVVAVECVGDLVAWARGPRGDGYAAKIERIVARFAPFVARLRTQRPAVKSAPMERSIIKVCGPPSAIHSRCHTYNECLIRSEFEVWLAKNQPASKIESARPCPDGRKGCMKGFRLLTDRDGNQFCVQCPSGGRYHPASDSCR